MFAAYKMFLPAVAVDTFQAADLGMAHQGELLGQETDSSMSHAYQILQNTTGSQTRHYYSGSEKFEFRLVAW